MSDPSPAPLETWLKERRSFVLAVLVGASILLRIIAWIELRQTPCVHGHAWTQSDMHFFDEWARAIAAGDWLSDAEAHPLMEWQKGCARQWFAENPGQRALYPGSDEAAARGLWNHWFRGKQFHQEPLYVYLVAITYRIFGADPRAVFLWQAVLGVLSNVLVWLLARRLFGERAGAVAALLALFYAPLILYEFALVRTPLSAFIGLALAYGLDLALEKTSPRGWFLAGVGCGVALLCQTTFAAFLVGASGVLYRTHRQDRRLLLRFGGVLAAGLLLGVCPLLIRNAAVGAPPLGWASVGPLTFLSDNEASFDPDNGSAGLTESQVRIMGRAEGRMGPIVVDSLKSHASGGWLWLLARKFAMTWRGYEEPDNQNFYYGRRFSSILALAPFTFTVISPVALVGLSLAAKDARRCAILLGLVLAGVAVGVLALPLSRYRAPFVSAMIPFAALAIVRGLEAVSARRWKPLAGGVIAVLLLGLWAARPLPPTHPLIYAAEYAAPYDFYWFPRMKQAGSPGEALAILERSLQVEPPELIELAKKPPQVSTYQVELAGPYSRIYRIYSGALTAAGRGEDAARAGEFSDLLKTVSTLRP